MVGLIEGEPLLLVGLVGVIIKVGFVDVGVAEAAQSVALEFVGAVRVILTGCAFAVVTVDVSIGFGVAGVVAGVVIAGVVTCIVFERVVDVIVAEMELAASKSEVELAAAFVAGEVVVVGESIVEAADEEGPADIAILAAAVEVKAESGEESCLRMVSISWHRRM